MGFILNVGRTTAVKRDGLKGLKWNAVTTSPPARAMNARVIPHPGHSMVVIAWKGQNRGLADSTVSGAIPIMVINT